MSDERQELLRQVIRDLDDYKTREVAWHPIGTVTKDDALFLLNAIKNHWDTEGGHVIADEILLRLIDDSDIAEAWNAVDKWFA